jgi:hypothetical protein
VMLERIVIAQERTAQALEQDSSEEEETQSE